MTKRGPELVVQTLAAINVHRWGYPALGSFSVIGGRAAVGVPLLAEVPLLVGTPLLVGAR